MNVFISIVLLCVVSYAKDAFYFLPNDSVKLKAHVEKLIKNSQNSIDIAMYNFEHKKLAKLLKNSIKKGIKVSVVFDSNKIDTEKKLKYDYLKKNGANTYIADRKMHLKLALFDNKTAMFGSLNWTKASFEDNYEIVYITDNTTVVKKSKKIFKELKEK